MNKIVFVEWREKEETALNKAPDDVLRIAESLGFEPFPVRSCVPKNKNILFRILARIHWSIERLRILCYVRKGTIVLIQAPPLFLCRRAGYEFLSHLKSRGIRFIYLIHDLGELRLDGLGRGIAQMQTRKTLSVCDRVIAHNECMRAWLMSQGVCAEKLIVLGVFDYLIEDNARVLGAAAWQREPSVVVAGNLSPSKSPFVYQLNKVSGVSWNLFGPYYEKIDGRTSINYMGSFSPDVLPQKLTGNFGLVWDGDSIDTCSGITGEYLRYNNPHKLSLYLACGMPVIIWAQAAEADFVLKNGLGITVNSLGEIPFVIANLGQSGYLRLSHNCMNFTRELRAGQHTRTALISAMSGLE